MPEQRFPVLSVTRPWSSWLAHGIKDIENRTWRTNYLGPLWIHAAKSWDDDALDFAEQIGGALTDGQIMQIGSLGPYPAGYPTGIVALVTLAGVCERGREFRLGCTACGPWAAHGQYHWRIANPRPLVEPVEARGRLNLWWPDTELQAQLATARFISTEATRAH